MDGLIASIKAVGLVEPITVTPEGESFRILTGHRRYRAAKEAGLKEIEVLIREPEAEMSRRRKSVVSNVQREDVGVVELAEALKALLDEDPAIPSQRELARIIGKDEAWLSGMLRVLTLPTHLQQKLRISQVAVPYDTAIRVARVTDPVAQESLIDLALGGASAQELREQIRQFKSGNRSGSRRALRLQKALGGYTASVHGPARKDAKVKMLAALNALIDEVKRHRN
jgi:ParB family chromosome partitioning protein